MVRALDLLAASTLAFPAVVIAALSFYALLIFPIFWLLYVGVPETIVFALIQAWFLVACVLSFRLFAELSERFLLAIDRSLEEYGAFEYAACHALVLAVPMVTWLVLCAFFADAAKQIPTWSLGLVLPVLVFVAAYLGYRWRFKDR